MPGAGLGGTDDVPSPAQGHRIKSLPTLLCVNWPPEETLTSAQRKLKRGVEHVQTLCREADAFEDGEAYFFESERELRSAQEAEYRCFAVQRKEMPTHWPLLAGEAIQNLRSALDHLVFEKSGGNRRTQFPIFTDRCEFQVLSPRYLKGVPEATRASIEEAQPYRYMPEDTAHHPLAQLSALSNLDKHRVLTTFVSAVTNEGVGIPSGAELTWTDVATNKRLGAGKAQISTFVVRTEGEVKDVKVEPMFSYEVRIERRPVGTLKWIANSAYRTMAEVDTGEKLSPLAPYPL
jgi:hypothetical protein